jgi:hypothetical protein
MWQVKILSLYLPTSRKRAKRAKKHHLPCECGVGTFAVGWMGQEGAKNAKERERRVVTKEIEIRR